MGSIKRRRPPRDPFGGVKSFDEFADEMSKFGDDLFDEFDKFDTIMNDKTSTIKNSKIIINGVDVTEDGCMNLQERKKIAIRNLIGFGIVGIIITIALIFFYTIIETNNSIIDKRFGEAVETITQPLEKESLKTERKL